MNERREKRIQIWLMMKRMKNFKYLFNAAALSADKMDFFLLAQVSVNRSLRWPRRHRPLDLVRFFIRLYAMVS